MEGVALTAEDEAILRLESSTVVGHTCKVVRLEGPMPDLSALRRRVEAGLGAAPALTRRLHVARDGALSWVPDDGFDVAAHVVPSTRGAAAESDLHGLVADLFAEHLDRARPLWRIDVAPLAGGGAALVWRVHHALADGTTLMRYARALLWDQPDPGPGTGSGPHPAGGGGGTTDDDARRRGHLAGFLRREFARSLWRSPFDGAIGTRRAVAFTAAPLDAVHRAAHEVGATLNDAVLSVVAGGLRHWVQQEHGRLGSVRVKVPVSLHHEAADAANRDSFFTVPVSLNETDPVRRLREVRTATRERKHADDAETLDGLLRHLAWVDPALGRLCARIEASPRSFAVNVSNVPGPRDAVTVLSRPVTGLYSLAEVGEHHALRVAVVSLADRVFFGLCADPDVVPDLSSMAQGVTAECRALVDTLG